MSADQAKPSAGAHCNLDYLLLNLGRNPAAARRLIGLFLENHPRLVERLRMAARSVDLAALKDVVHDVRSSCVLFSALEAVELARGIELAIHRHEADLGVAQDWSERIEPLCDELALVAHELRVYYEAAPGGAAAGTD